MLTATLAGWHHAALAASAGAMVLWAVAIAELVRRGRAKPTDPHHAYWGLMLLAAPVAWGPWAILCWGIGLWWVLDDAWQHVRQTGDATYRSPVHRCYVRMVMAFR